MTREGIWQLVVAYVEMAAENRVSKERALSAEVAGMRLYAKPFIAVGRADDPMFEALRAEEAVGPHFMTPGEWLRGAKSVISVFVPVTQSVRSGNARDMSWPSEGWLHARIEGQGMINGLAKRLCDVIRANGCKATAPSLDERFRTGGDDREDSIPRYNSNWSERHVAFVCGHGTFGLSRGLITQRGVAGRFTSVITNVELEYNEREYTGLYQYCSMCGACARNCPAGAISIEEGKDHAKCAAFLDKTKERHPPYYGCGKCQVRVPCEEGPAAG